MRGSRALGSVARIIVAGWFCVTLADPKTWRDGDPDGCILTWDEAHEFASTFNPDLSSTLGAFGP